MWGGVVGNWGLLDHYSNYLDLPSKQSLHYPLLPNDHVTSRLSSHETGQSPGDRQAPPSNKELLVRCLSGQIDTCASRGDVGKPRATRDATRVYPQTR